MRKEEFMSQYVVERYLPGITPEQLTAAAVAAKSTTAEMTDEGTPVRYLRSTFLPGEEKCYCLFDGPSADAVRAANERAGIPYDRVVEAMHLAADDLS